MAYTKQNFENGQILTAEQLNHMEQGIEDASSAVVDVFTNTLKVASAKNPDVIDNTFVHVSDEVIPREALLAGGAAKIVGLPDVEELEVQWTGEDVFVEPETVAMIMATTFSFPVAWIAFETTTLEGITMERGINFMHIIEGDSEVYVDSVTFNGYSFATRKIAPSLQHQSDWNQNDKTAPDYIKNKPFYDVKPWIPPVTLPEPGAERMEILSHMISSSATDKVCMIKENTKYVVNFNGTDYECESFTLSNFPGTVFLGNLHILVSGFEDNGLPFLLKSTIHASYEMIEVHVDDSLTSCTISIRLADEPTIKHLDPKYIKDMYYETEMFELLVDNVTLDFNSSPFIKSPAQFEVIEDKKYKIIWDGELYVCIAYPNDYGEPCIGNAELDGATGGNGEPFFVTTSGSNVYILAQDAPGEHTISVAEYRPEIHHIDNKYIKDMYGVEGEATFIGSLSFTATSANTMDFTLANAREGADAKLIDDLGRLVDKGEIVEVEINGAVGMMSVGQDRAYIQFSGALSGSLHRSNGSVWSATVNIPDVALTTGTTYTVNFYDARKRKLKTIDPKYLPPVVLTSPNGTKFNLTVSDDGTLSATPVS